MKASSFRNLNSIFGFLFVVQVSAQTGADILWVTNAHFNDITSVSFAADSLRLASGATDRHAKVWLLPSGNLLRDVSSPNQWVLSTAMSSNGTLLATGGEEGKVRVWRVNDGGIEWQLPTLNNNLTYATAFSPDGTRFADSRSQDIAVVRHASNGAFALWVQHNNTVSSVAFSPDSALLASGGSDQVARITRLADTNILHTLTGHAAGVISVDFSPDGSLLLTGAGDGTSRLWNVSNGACVRVIEGAGGQAKFSANGKLFFTLEAGVFQLWRVASGAHITSITNSGAVTFDVSKNGKYLAYGREEDYAVVLARTPLVIDEFTRTGNETVLHWQGGSGLYQLQSNTNFTTTGWQNFGPATTNTLATNVSASTLFFRVQSLPNP